MGKLTFRLSAAFFLSTWIYVASGQGCSDAGFCTLNSFKPHTSDSTAIVKNQLKVGVSYGSADHSIVVFGNYLEYNRQLTNKLGLDIKLTTLSQNGNSVSAFGLSDVFVNANYAAGKKLKLTAGVKVPLTNGNNTQHNLALPMDYQSSLGTFDVIVGIGYELKKLQLVLAMQQPLIQNKNEFIAENYAADSKLRSFQSTNNFKRSGDVLLRISYPLQAGKKIKITPSLLPIYHLTNDRYTDATGAEKTITGSQGLTLNGNAYIDYEINNRHALQLNAGSPFVFRKTRPDGLTRHLVVNVEYRIKF